ncbi:polysaccharide deacetylase family protein [Streptomyces sp. NPDC059468]|uniref:polysaccharide deacetylase family protein n=1 Tax=Streptomyces sp. NPDC059468 TaxID=3346845 RepID=UPI0036BA19B8
MSNINLPVTGQTGWGTIINDDIQSLNSTKVEATQEQADVANAQAAAEADAASKYLPKTDPSVTNARTPLPHASTHAAGGTDALTAAAIGADVAGAATSAVSAHVAAVDPHGDRADAATKYLLKTDPSVTNARTPTAHATAHAAGGSDVLTPAAIGADVAGAATSAVSAHVAAVDPHGDRADAATKYVPLSQIGAVSGVASLDSTGVIPAGQVPGVYMPPTRRMPKWVQPSTIITQMQAGHGFTNNAGSTFVANDTADFLIPGQACKITTGGTGASANITKTGMPNMDTTGKVLRCRVKIDDITHMAGFNVYLGSSSLANYYKWVVQGGATGSNFIPSGGSAGSGAGWYTVTLHFADATTSGTPSRSAITDLRFQVTDDNTGNLVTLHVQDAELIPDASSIFPNGVISITFDDTYANVYNYALPKLAQYGYPASLYNIQSLVGGSGRMTTAQLYALQDQFGWEMGSHAYLDADHALTYTGMTAAQLDNDLRQMKAWEIVNGLRGMDGTAYPLGQFGLTSDNVPTTNVVRKYNGYARTTTRKTYETFPPADPYRLRAQSAVTTYTGGYAPSTVTGTDLAKIKANQLWGIYVFHNIVTTAPASSTEIAQSDFNAIVDAINAQGIPVLPIGDVLRYYG